MNVWKPALIIAVASGMLLVFQNCGEPMASSKNSIASGGLPPGPGNFKAGDTFDFAKVPYVSQMLEVQLVQQQYDTQSGPKAVAIAKSGLGFVKIGGANSQTETDRLALEGCTAITRGQACALLASGAFFSLNHSDLDKSFLFTLSTSGGIANTPIPFIDVAGRATALSRYTGRAAPKALAISLDGTLYEAFNEAAFPLTNVAEAIRLAMQRCELTALITPCTLFAQDQTLAFDPAQLNAAATIPYAAGTIGNSVPGMRQADFTAYIVPYLNFLTANPTATANIYISATGAWGASYTTNSATLNTDTKAAADCATGNPDNTNRPCRKFATKNVTRLEPGTALRALNGGSTELHCKAIPRLNCATHLEMGCPTGSGYYTTHSGLKLETCL